MGNVKQSHRQDTLSDSFLSPVYCLCGDDLYRFLFCLARPSMESILRLSKGLLTMMVPFAAADHTSRQ